MKIKMTISNYTRRNFLKSVSLGIPGIYMMSMLPGCASTDEKFYSKAMGCFMGAAIGDAMGGPIEAQHYKRIQKYAGEINGLIEYKSPWSMEDMHGGYALHPEPGSVTDDSYIRMDLARYLLDPNADFTAEQFANWLIKNAKFDNWWKAPVKTLMEVEKGTYLAEEAGLYMGPQGGGGGWWQPIAILFEGDIEKTVKAVDNMCRIWKGPQPRNILTAVCAGQAAALQEGSTIDSIVDIVMKYSGPLAKKLFERTVDIAHKSNSREELYQKLYATALVNKRVTGTEIDGPMPEHVEPEDYVEGRYSSGSFAEQQPWALAYFVWGQGDPHRTVVTAAMGGRDADSIATNTAAWLGAMSGIDVWPKEWIKQVQSANLVDFDLMQTGEELINKAKELSSVG